MAAPTLLGYVESDWSNVTSADEVTGTLTWTAAGNVVVCLGATENNTVLLATPTATGLTFADLTGSPTDTANSCKGYAWSATAAGSGSSALTSDNSGGDARGISAWAWSGVSALGTPVVNVGTGLTVSVTVAGTDSTVVMVLGDWNATADATITTVPSGGTIREANAASGQATFLVIEWTNQAAGTRSYGATDWSGTGTVTKIAVEVVGPAGGSTVNGTAAATLGGLTGSATGTPSVPGTGAATLGALAGTATGVRTVLGTGQAVMGALAGSAAGTRATAGTAAATLAALAATATGTRTTTGVGSALLGALSGSATGLRTIGGTGAADLGPLTATGVVGAATIHGTAAATLAALTGTATGTRTATGTGSALLGTLTGTAGGLRTVLGAAAATLGRLVATASSVGAAPMNLAEVMDAIADQLDTIDGLRVFAYPPDAVSPPAAIVSYPETYTYDNTYRRGMDRVTLPVVVVVGRPTDRASRDRIAQFCDGSGAASIKTVVEAGTYTAFHSVRVTGAEFDVVSIGGTDYLSATFDLDIAGQGA